MRKVILFFLILSTISLNAQESICDYKSDFLRIKDRLIRYFQNFDHSNHPSLNQRLLLAFLNEKYQLKIQFPKNYLQFKITHVEDSLVQKYYFRLLHRKYKFNVKELNQDYEKTQGIEHLLLWSIYPDFLPLDNESKNTIQQPLGYDSFSIRMICHLTLAYYWAKQFTSLDSTIKSTFENHFEIWKNLTEKGLKFLKGYTDTAIEGLLTYVFIHQIEKLPIGSLKEFLYYSSSDGGYPWNEDKSSSSNFHASILALWLVCELDSYCK